MISYTSFTFFIICFGLTFIVYNIAPKKIKYLTLLILSYAFYFMSSKGHVIPILLDTLVIWGDGLLLQKLSDEFSAKKKGLKRDEKKQLKIKYKKKKTAVLWIGILIPLVTLIICKYTNFLISSANTLFFTSIKSVNIVQPLGISFFTLSAISYLSDIYYGKIEARKNPLRVALFLSFMFTVVEGPITRYNNLGYELEKPKSFDIDAFEKGAMRVIYGIFKKVVVADRAAMYVTAVFDSDKKLSGGIILVAILFYTVQLYFEFSGVMDIVCGLCEMIGITLPENFSRPFFARSINEFWQRWHITLGSWLRDYIFYPISLSKPFMKLSKSARKKVSNYFAGLIPTSFALFFVWLGNGFWHGAGWKYICYGLYYYIFMIIGLYLEPTFAKLCEKLKINRKSRGFKAFQIFRTFVIVNVGMLIFRAESLTQAFNMLVGIFTRFSLKKILPVNSTIGLDQADYTIIIASWVIVFIVSLLLEKGINIRERLMKLPVIIRFIGFFAAIVVIIIIGAYGDGYGVVDLIYANF